MKIAHKKIYNLLPSSFYFILFLILSGVLRCWHPSRIVLNWNPLSIRIVTFISEANNLGSTNGEPVSLLNWLVSLK